MKVINGLRLLADAAGALRKSGVSSICNLQKDGGMADIWLAGFRQSAPAGEVLPAKADDRGAVGPCGKEASIKFDALARRRFLKAWTGEISLIGADCEGITPLARPRDVDRFQAIHSKGMRLEIKAALAT
jgi:hypothetical protein